MAFNRLKAAAPAAASAPTTHAPTVASAPAAAPAPAPAPVAAAAPVREAVVETAVAVAAPAGNALSISLFGGEMYMGAGLMAITEVQDGAGGPSFPVLTVSGGNAGGAFVPLAGTPEEIADLLPQGRKPVEGVFLAYRNEVTAWPISFQESQAAQANGEKGKPAWSAVVPCTNAEASRLLAEACQKYQFTKGVNKPRWNVAESGVGHIRPTLQLMVYLPSVDDVIVLQTVSHYSSWKRSLDNLKRHVDPRTGALTQFPTSIRSVTTAEQIGPNTVSIHTLDIGAVMNDSGKAWWDQYAAWRNKLADSPDVLALIKEWVMGEDRPLTQDVLEKLRKAKTTG